MDFIDFNISGTTVLTAMITPAVLISACGTLILSTSQRLGRVITRVRALSDKVEQMAHTDCKDSLSQMKLKAAFDQLDKLADRSELLALGLTSFYVSAAVFIATSVSIGVLAAIKSHSDAVTVVLALIGSGFLLYGSAVLIKEARLAWKTTILETHFVRELGHICAADVDQQQHKKS